MAHAWEYDVREALPADLTGIGVDAQRRALGVAAARVEAAIIRVWPVDTGKSLAGFRREPVGASWRVYNDVSYTPYVHDGLATETAIRATLAARAVTSAALARITARQRTVGARGSFRLLRTVATTPLAKRARAIDSARRAIAGLQSGGIVERSVYSMASAQLRGANFDLAIATLRGRGFLAEARAVKRIGERAGLMQGAAVA